MEVIALRLPGLKLVKPKVHRDSRGFFVETFSAERYAEHGIDRPFVQDNHSLSHAKTLRGLHFQSEPGQAKLVRVAVGRIFDVAVDIRPNSPTFGQWDGVYLDAEAHHQLFVPVGFAHGFCVVSEQAHVLYKVTSPYVAAYERSLRWDDPDFGIAWPVHEPHISPRDACAPTFAQWRRSV